MFSFRSVKPGNFHQAQRLLVGRGEDSGGQNRFETPLHRLQALWTLDGMGKLKTENLQKAAKDADPRVRAAATRLGAEIVLNDESDASVRLHALLSPKPLSVIAEHLTSPEDDLSRIAAMTTIHGKEIALLELLLKLLQTTAHPAQTPKLPSPFQSQDAHADAILPDSAETVVGQCEG